MRAIFVSMNLLNEKINKIALEAAANNGFFLIDLIVRGNDKNRVIEIFIDGENNVSADDCAKVSREINSELEEDPSLGSYRLDVSSPGVDRPLKYLKQYPKHVDRKFDLIYTEGETKKKTAAVLKKIDGEELTFFSNNNEFKVNFNNILKAKVIISFS